MVKETVRRSFADTHSSLKENAVKTQVLNELDQCQANARKVEMAIGDTLDDLTVPKVLAALERPDDVKVKRKRKAPLRRTVHPRPALPGPVHPRPVHPRPARPRTMHPMTVRPRPVRPRPVHPRPRLIGGGLRDRSIWTSESRARIISGTRGQLPNCQVWLGWVCG